MTEQHTREHEARHAAVGDALGWKSNGISVEGGEHFSGITRSVPPPFPAGQWEQFDPSLPFVCWPASIRQNVEARVLQAMAGDVAAEIEAPPGRLPDAVSERIAEQVAELPGPEPEDLEQFTTMVNDPGAPDDEDYVVKLVWAAHGQDHASAAHWLFWLEQQCKQLVASRLDAIHRLAAALELRSTLTGEQVTAILRDGDAR